MGVIKSKGWYDDVYAKGGEYAKHYSESFYYPLWQRLYLLITSRSVFEIGCGSGQLAKMLFDNGICQYRGFDFSRRAIKIAREGSILQFGLGDALTPEAYDGIGQFGCVIATEVFEHTDDMKILSFIPFGKEIIFTVPDFDYPSHIRHFSNEQEVISRYMNLIEITHYEKFDRWHIVKGIKK